MKEIFIEGSSLPEAYHKALKALYENGEEVDCPDYNTSQKEVSMTVCINEPLTEPRISRCFIGGEHALMQYELEMVDGLLDFMVGATDKTWSYTYHQRYAVYLPLLIDELNRNPDSRRAVISIRDNAIDFIHNDPACMNHLQFFIRDNKLHCKVLFRSNDLCKAFFMNAFALVRLQEKIANELGVEVGSYVHRANSMHCYARDYDMLKGYVDRIDSGKNLTYEYEGFYKDMMEEELPSIMEMVEEQKRKYGIVSKN